MPPPPTASAIRLLTPDDAELLSGLAVTIYQEYYLHLWHDGAAWYIEHTYNIQKIRTELSDLNNFHYIACVDKKPIGYLKLRLDQTWKGLEHAACMEVERIYILKEAAREGLGKKFMNAAFEVATFHNRDTVFLKAMDSSLDAIAFYQHLGFEIFDTLTLPYEQMKVEYRGMVVLKRTLVESPSEITNQ